ncbi:MAG: tRNA (adenosine(37)-N6)-threonylcarbamoyltransferase complex dimerization subunit type 1 TsaB [Dermatophilaceae bacterium]
MLLLAIDTATSAVTVALHDGQTVLAERTTLDSRRHGELVAPAMAGVLAEAGRTPGDVSAVVSGTGPGPFTGLRVGLVTARTFAFARAIPVFGVCSLDAMAHQAWLEDEVGVGRSCVVATDARRKEVYWARYDITAGGAVRRGQPMVAKASSIAAQVQGLPVIGRGAILYADSFGPVVGPLDVSAGALADLAARMMAAGHELHSPEPMYLRRPDAIPPPPRKAALP